MAWPDLFGVLWVTIIILTLLPFDSTFNNISFDILIVGYKLITRSIPHIFLDNCRIYDAPLYQKLGFGFCWQVVKWAISLKDGLHSVVFILVPVIEAILNHVGFRRAGPRGLPWLVADGTSRLLVFLRPASEWP